MELMSDPLISVLMSVRNAGAFLRPAIDSLLTQSRGDFELLVTDDASQDRTADVLEEYARADARVRVFKEPVNIGLTAALEKMTALARGEYIARMDADDLSLPERFAQQIKRFERQPDLGVLGTWTRRILEDGQPLDEYQLPDDHDWIARQVYGGVNVMFHGSLMFRRGVLQSLGRPIWRFRFGQDYDLHLRLMDRTRYGHVQQALYAYRLQGQSMSASAAAQRVQLRQLMVELYQLRQKGEPEFDWKAREAEVLSQPAAKADPQMKAAWTAYFRGKQQLSSGKGALAAESFREAMTHPVFGRKAKMMRWLSRLGVAGQKLHAATEQLVRLRNPIARHIKPARP